MSNLKMQVSAEDSVLIDRIVSYAKDMAKDYGLNFKPLDCMMDLTICHANGCPLDLERMAKASDPDLVHDVWGIAKWLDRKTGRLTGVFWPRFARSQHALQ